MSSVPGFLTKTFEIFSSPEYIDCCGWGPQGDTIVIRKIEQFSKQVLPKYFKHSNFQSFVRQLNMYDFHKTVQDPNHGEFRHPHFKQNKPELLQLIKRKANKPIVPPHEANPSQYTVTTAQSAGNAPSTTAPYTQLQHSLKKLGPKVGSYQVGDGGGKSIGNRVAKVDSVSTNKQGNSGKTVVGKSSGSSNLTSNGTQGRVMQKTQSSSNYMAVHSAQQQIIPGVGDGSSLVTTSRISEEPLTAKGVNAVSINGTNIVAELQQQLEIRKDFEKLIDSKISRIERDNEFLKQLLMESHVRNIRIQERVERVLRVMYDTISEGKSLAVSTVQEANTEIISHAAKSGTSVPLTNLLVDLEFLRSNAEQARQQLSMHEQQLRQHAASAGLPNGQVPISGQSAEEFTQLAPPLLFPINSSRQFGEGSISLERLDSLGSLGRLPSLDITSLPSSDIPEFLTQLPTIDGDTNKADVSNKNGTQNGSETSAREHLLRGSRNGKLAGAALNGDTRGNSFELAASSVSAPRLVGSGYPVTAPSAGKPITRSSGIELADLSAAQSGSFGNTGNKRKSESITESSERNKEKAAKLVKCEDDEAKTLTASHPTQQNDVIPQNSDDALMQRMNSMDIVASLLASYESPRLKPEADGPMSSHNPVRDSATQQRNNISTT